MTRFDRLPYRDPFTSGLYILNDKLEPVSPESYWQWVEWRVKADETNGRIMLRSTFKNGTYVSSVFLGWAYDFAGTRTPLYYETMVFEGPADWQMRASNHNELILSHKICLAAVAVALRVPLTDVKHEGRLCISTDDGLQLPASLLLPG